jgi:hypothetical protein
VTLVTDSHIREVDGFENCESIRRIDIPASAEIIGYMAFGKCRLVTEVIFIADSSISEKHGSQKCESLGRINKPGYIRIITKETFCGRRSLKTIFPGRCSLDSLTLDLQLWFNHSVQDIESAFVLWQVLPFVLIYSGRKN